MYIQSVNIMEQYLCLGEPLRSSHRVCKNINIHTGGKEVITSARNEHKVIGSCFLCIITLKLGFNNSDRTQIQLNLNEVEMQERDQVVLHLYVCMCMFVFCQQV